MNNKAKEEYHTQYGTLFKKSEQWLIEAKKPVLIYQVYPSSIMIDEPQENINYGLFKFHLDSNNYAHLIEPLKFNLNALQDFRMEYITLMVLSAFFKENSTHQANAYIQTRLEHILSLVNYSNLPVRNNFEDIKVEYKTLHFVRKLFPKNSTLKVVHYIDKQMEFLVDQHFLDSKD